MTTKRTRRTVLAASGSLTMLGLAGCFGGDEEHVAVESFELVDPETGDSLATVADDRWEGGPLLVPLEGTLSVGARAEDADGELALGGDEPYRLGAVPAEDGDDPVAIEPREDRLDLIGRATGETRIVAELWDGDRFGWDSPELAVEVVDDFEDAANHRDTGTR
ncbi:hypothetical protein [Natronococcus occultus]|uniref:Lipoprotein n=1 Tax=Natronococcus occultus SP4 TaxID=694430 RepID=L0JZW0_9EURY|nr:hypothetical protein [Natronococcus occultus]AGB37403.1 hypothetical protein Natoc_1598 [Natronococcus occultus SP4]